MTMPTYEQIAERLVELSKERSEWAGMPIPSPEPSMHPLRVEPRYPYRFHVDTKDTVNECPGPDEGLEEVNRFWSVVKGTDVIVIRKPNGRITYGVNTYNRGRMLLGTMLCSVVWPLKAEYKAQQKLAEILPKHMFENYLKVGCILETSKRSGVLYMFRRSRPTLAIKADLEGELRLLCGLCLHPIGYYQGTWAGVMTPTDEVIAHLCMMRGDERKFWANANQHPAWHPSCGL